MSHDYLAVASVTLEPGAALRVSSATENYLSTGALTLNGPLRIERSGVRVGGAFSGAGPVTFGEGSPTPEAFASGLIFDNGSSLVVSNAITADPAIASRATVGVGAGTTVTYQGTWQG